MKIRLGFVSNSSSSSFCIFGACFSPEEVKKILEDNNQEVPGKYELADALAKLTGYYVEAGLDYEYLYLGYEVEGFPRDKTPSQLEGKIIQELKEKGIEIKGCGFMHEGWYDG